MFDILRPKMYAGLFNRASGFDLGAIPPSKLAHCVIDVQREFCDPDFHEHGKSPRGDEQTARLAEHIAEIVPLFRAAAVPTYMIHYAPYEAYGGFFKVAPQGGDIVVGKFDDSAFAGSNIGRALRQNGTEALLVSGFNTSLCVRSTVLDALERKFKVCLLEDCIGDEWRFRELTAGSLDKMRRKGAMFLTAEDALAQIRQYNGP